MNNGMSGILGVDLAQHPTVSDRPEAVHRTPARGGVWRDRRDPRVVLLARGGRGMGCCEPFGVLSPHVRAAGQSRCRLGSARGVRRDGDLSVLPGPDSEVGRAISRHRFDLADTLLRRWREVAGGQVYLEIVNHRTAPRALGEQRPGPDLSTAMAKRMWQYSGSAGSRRY